VFYGKLFFLYTNHLSCTRGEYKLNFRLLSGDVLKLSCSTLVLGVFEGEGIKGTAGKVDEALGGVITRLAQEERFGGELGKSISVNTLDQIGAQRVLVIGLGKRSKISPDTFRKAGIVVARKTKQSLGNVVVGFETDKQDGYVSAFAEGFILGGYEFDKYKTTNNKRETGVKEVGFLWAGLSDEVFRKEIEFAEIVSEATNFARDLVNEPPAVLTPTKLAEIAKDIARQENLECEIFDKEEIERRGMGGLLAVSRGSEEPPRFIHLIYKPRKKTRKSVAIVGKGITFDSGGLCIKPRESMRTMKMDMSGAACVLGVMKAIPRLNPPCVVHGLISATENMPGARAYKPDDIIRTFSGKTIEVVDTDAEGRIVLSDAISYAVKLGVGEIIDVATLTGACIVALGNYTAGIMGNDEKLIQRVIKAAQRAGEKVWQLPMDDELRKEIESDVADVKNVGSRWGGAITAAMFLEKFVENTPWVHLDIAGPAFFDKGSEWNPKGGTGFGVRTLIRYLLER
jgi:leucyl aminopeptidase